MILAVKAAVLSPFGVGGDAKGTAQLRKPDCIVLGISNTITFSPLKIRLYWVEALLVWKFLQSLQGLPPRGRATHHASNMKQP